MIVTMHNAVAGLLWVVECLYIQLIDSACHQYVAVRVHSLLPHHACLLLPTVGYLLSLYVQLTSSLHKHGI